MFLLYYYPGVRRRIVGSFFRIVDRFNQVLLLYAQQSNTELLNEEK